MRKDRLVNLIRVIKYLTDNPEGSWVRQISRDLDMHPETVRRALSAISMFIEEKSVNEQLPMGLANLPTIIRLKSGVTIRGILRFLSVKEKLNRR